MNKHRRHEIKMLKYKKRLKNFGIKDDTKGNYYAFRSHGAPCSCSACQQKEDSYDRAKEKEKTLEEIDNELIDFACAISMDMILNEVKKTNLK